MRRDFLDGAKSDGYGEFLTACENLRNSKFVIAENKIAAVLKAIADNKKLYSMFAATLYGFDYKTVLSECTSSGSFTLPLDAKKAIALVFRMLIDIDNGKLSFQKFLETYLPSVSINESFARFSLEVVTPFESYCRTYFAQADSGNNAAATPEGALMSGVFNALNSGNKAPGNLKVDALTCVATLIEIARSAITGTIEQSELIYCLNGLTRALKSDDMDYIISAFLGVKYAIAYFFGSNNTVREIFKKLDYDVKHMFD